jgi:hypothetical protein
MATPKNKIAWGRQKTGLFCKYLSYNVASNWCKYLDCIVLNVPSRSGQSISFFGAHKKNIDFDSLNNVSELQVKSSSNKTYKK